MRKNILLTLGAIGLSSGLFAQLLTNDGAILKIDPGATLVVKGGVSNINGGTIDNDGTLEIEGDLLVDGTSTFDNANPSLVIFSGANSTNVTSGTGTVYDDVEIGKASGQNINLMDDLVVGGTLTFDTDNTKISVGANDLVMQDAASIVGADNNNYVVTGDVGFLRKEGLGTGESFEFPVGYDGTTYNPATLAGVNTHVSDVFSVRVLENLTLDGLAETMPATEEAVNAMWEITEGTAGGSDINMTLQWASSDQLPNFPALVGVARHDGTDWDLLAPGGLGAPVGGDPYTRTRNNVTQFSAFAVGGEPVGNKLLLNASVLLQGSYIGGSPVMKDNLRSGGLIPTNEPYAGAPYNYLHTGFGGGESVAGSVFNTTGDDAIVDWLIVELRDAATGASVQASKSGLLQRDGDIVDLDGTSPLVISGAADGNYHIAVKHRNHLTIRTASAQALSLTPLVYDFSTALSQAYDNPSIATNDAMKDMGAGGPFAMWAGDATRDGKVRVTPLNFPPPAVASDRTYLLDNALGGNPGAQLNAYSESDINMDGKVRVTPLNFPPPAVPSDATFILDNVLGGNPSGQVTSHN